MNPAFRTPATNNKTPEKNDKKVAYKMYSALPTGANFAKVLHFLILKINNKTEKNENQNERESKIEKK